jgi:hypothetical protein
MGIVPAIVDLRPKSSIDQKGFAKTEPTVEAKAVWGDTDQLGCPPEQHGWRVSKTAPKGMKILIRTPIPPDWTHVIAQHFHDYESADGRTRRSATCVPYSSGRDDLFKMLSEYYGQQTEWESEELSGLLGKMLDKELFNANFDRLLVPTPATNR